MRKFLILAGLLLLAMTAGCGDDGTSPDEAPFAVNLTVTDLSGQPVPGLEARLHVFVPDWLVPSAAKPRTIVPFTLPVRSEVSLVVYDLDGNVVNKLFDSERMAGRYAVAFAVDGEGNPLVGTHLYRCELVAMVDSVEHFRGETFMTLYTSIDSQQRPVMGVTDARGKLSYGVKTEFPYLYQPGPQMAIDENGEERGTFEFIDKVQITLLDPGSGLALNRDVDIGSGTNTIRLVWDPALAAKANCTSPDQSPAAIRVEIARDIGPSGEYSIGPGYPNPFN